MTLIALLGANALLWLYVWLISAALASYLSDRKGFGEKPGLASGLILSLIGVVIWLIVPAKPDSKWKVVGPVGQGKRKDIKRPTA
jgi:hypothetical protein